MSGTVLQPSPHLPTRSASSAVQTWPAALAPLSQVRNQRRVYGRRLSQHRVHPPHCSLSPIRAKLSCSASDASAAQSNEGPERKPFWLLSASCACALLLFAPAVAQLLSSQLAVPKGMGVAFAGLFLQPQLGGFRRRLARAFSHSADAAADAAPVVEEKEKKAPDQISIESAEEEQEVNAVAITELGNVQTPASVWLPYKDTNVNRNRLRARFGPAVVTIGGRLGRALLQAVRLPINILSLLSFKAQQIMLASTGTKLVAVFLAGIPMCILGGLIYSWTSGKTLLDGMINAYGALYKIPGVMVIGEINSATAHVMNILWLVGTFTFAIVLGVVTEDIVNTVISIRSGNYPVVAANHTLILGWNSQTISLLRQIAINKVERGKGVYDGPVVILADRDKEEMDEELRSSLRGFALEWHTRTGAPHSIIDLRRVAAGQAKTVILLNPDGSAEDVGKKQVAAILGVQAARSATKPQPFLRLQPQNIAIQVPENAEDHELIGAARGIMKASAQKFNLTYLSCKRDISTLLALSAIQPGVASVYCTIVQQTQRGVEFYLKRFPELAGKTFGEARRSFDNAVLCGYMRAGEKGEPELNVNCKDSDILQETDRVIALSQTGKFQPANRSEKDEERRATGSDLVKLGGDDLRKLADQHKLQPKHIVVLWFEENIRDLLISLAAFAPVGSSVTIISKSKPEDFPEESKIGGTTFEFLEGDPSDFPLLQKAGVAMCDSVIIGGTLDERPAKEADALTLSLVMLVQECLAGSGRAIKRPAHIVGMVRKPDSIEVANFLMERLGKGGATAELVQPDELTSGIISQVAAEPDIAPLFAAFVYSSEGSEIFLRRPWLYRIPEDREISFAQVSEVCRLRNETAIGYISEIGEVLIAPRATSVRQFSRNDRILTIAES